jgi:hypothetical protein
MPDAALGGSLPKGDANGLSQMAGDLIREPERKRVIIAIVDNPETRVKNVTGDRLAIVRICRIEAVLAEDLAAAEKLMRRALERRTGQTVLPLDLEDELSAAFAEFDPAEPEEPADPGDQDEPGDAEDGRG